MIRARRWVRVGVPLALLAIIVAACGDDSDDDGTTDETTESSAEADDSTAPEESAESSDAGSDEQANGESADDAQPAALDFTGDFCEDFFILDDYLNSEEQDPAVVEAGFEHMAEVVPSGDSEAILALGDSVVASAEAGDFLSMFGDDFATGFAEITDGFLSECGYQPLEVTATEYELSGIPENLEVGDYAVSFDNQGTELHEAIFFRVDDDVDLTAEELLALPEDEAMTMVSETGAEAFGPPGTGLGSFTTLEPGRYVVACFIPVGSTPEVIAEAQASGSEPEGAPHFTEGMLTEFTVS